MVSCAGSGEKEELEFERERSLGCAGSPADGFANGRKRKAMKRCRAETAERLEVNRSAVTFVLGETVAGEIGVEFIEARIAVSFSKNGGCGDGNAARVPFDKGFLFDENVELHGVDQEIVGNDGKLLERGGHGLAAGLIDVPGVDAGGINFGDGPRERVFADAEREFTAAFGRKFLGIIEADDAAFGIEDDGGGNDRAEEGAAACFVDAGDARPAEFARGSLKTG